MIRIICRQAISQVQIYTCLCEYQPESTNFNWNSDYINFPQIRERSLESPYIYWYIVMEEDYTNDILRHIREGTQVRVILRTQHDNRMYHTESIAWYNFFFRRHIHWLCIQQLLLILHVFYQANSTTWSLQVHTNLPQGLFTPAPSSLMTSDTDQVPSSL